MLSCIEEGRREKEGDLNCDFMADDVGEEGCFVDDKHPTLPSGLPLSSLLIDISKVSGVGFH